jgi:enamine deaminase RidA (YjgF/YER057c/UK114 family)
MDHFSACNHHLMRWGVRPGNGQKSHFDARRPKCDRALLTGHPSWQALYVSGEIAIDPKTNQVMSNATIEDQTRRALDNISAILAADGLTMEHQICHLL